jgi:hypothetical protein
MVHRRRRLPTVCLLALVALALPAVLAAQPCGTPGRDGSPTLTGVVNTYYPGTATATGGTATSLSVGTPSGAAARIAAGDLLLVIQMQDAAINTSNTTNYGANNGTSAGSTNVRNSGLMEFVTATGPVAGGVVPILGGGNGGKLLNTYTNANWVDGNAGNGQRRFQVIRVPQYASPKITFQTAANQVTALAWNGTVGGVLAIDVDATLTFDSSGGAITVSVDGEGFRGGGGQTTTGSTGNNFSPDDVRRVNTLLFDASKGEGIAGTPRYVSYGTNLTDNGAANDGYPNGSFARGAPGNAGGGGTDGNEDGSGDTTNQNNCGGGGGGNGGAGGVGGNCWNTGHVAGGLGGAAFAASNNPAKAVMGGGSGAGDSNNFGPAHGAPGGGIIIIRVNKLAYVPANGTATLTANGLKPCAGGCTQNNGGGTTTGSRQDGAGGGGAGGSILIDVNTTNPPGGNSTAGLTLHANGGTGGDVDWPDNDPHGPGGGGGGGVVYISAAGATLTTTHGGHGAAGTPVADNVAFGSADGANGISATGPITFPGARPGYKCIVSQALLSRFRAVPAGGALVVEWETSSEASTAGFLLFRREERGHGPEGGAAGADGWVQVNERVLPVALESPQGGVYRFVDETASPFASYTYQLVEIEHGGRRRTHGPFTVAVDWTVRREPIAAPAGGGDRFERSVHPPTRQPAGGGAESTASPGKIARVAAALQLAVTDRGLYVVKATDIANAFGVPAWVAKAWIAQGRISLTNQGAAAAWQASADGSALRFFGDALASIYSERNVYWLVPGLAGPTMGFVDGGAPAPLAFPAIYPAQAHFEQNVFAGTAIAPDPSSDYWYWQAMISGDPSLGTNTFPLTVPAVAPGGTTATLTAHLQGASASGAPGEHHVSFRLNGTPLGETSWEGITPHDATFAFSSSLLHTGANTLELQGQLDAGVPLSISYTGSFDLAYPRQATTGGSPLFFTPDASGAMTVSGFGSGNILIYDVSVPASPAAVTHPTIAAPFGPHQVTFVAAAGHTYLVLDPSGYKAPALAAWIPPAVPLRSPANGADHLIIAPAALADAAGALAAYRRGQGLASQVVTLEEIYAEFNQGLASPLAVQAFLGYAANAWHPRPNAVVLAGSGNFDYKNYLGLGGNLMPPLMVQTSEGLFSGDGQLTAFPGGESMVVGRIPAASPAELRAVIAKLIAYEGSPSAPWKQQVLLLSDLPDNGGQFDWESNLSAALVPASFSQQSIDLSTVPFATARAQLLAQLGSGALLFNYVGHGGLDRLSSQAILVNADAAALTNGSRLPLVATATCVIGRFEVPGFQSLAEALLENPAGGAAAGWAPSGVGFTAQSSALDRALLAQLFAPGPQTLGSAVLGARQLFKAMGGDAAALATYNLFGDPALRLQKP